MLNVKHHDTKNEAKILRAKTFPITGQKIDNHMRSNSEKSKIAIAKTAITKSFFLSF